GTKAGSGGGGRRGGGRDAVTDGRENRTRDRPRECDREPRFYCKEPDVCSNSTPRHSAWQIPVDPRARRKWPAWRKGTLVFHALPPAGDALPQTAGWSSRRSSSWHAGGRFPHGPYRA